MKMQASIDTDSQGSGAKKKGMHRGNMKLSLAGLFSLSWFLLLETSSHVGGHEAFCTPVELATCKGKVHSNHAIQIPCASSAPGVYTLAGTRHQGTCGVGYMQGELP